MESVAVKHTLHVDASFNVVVNRGSYAYVFKRGKGKKEYKHQALLDVSSSLWAEIVGMISALKHAYQTRAIRTKDHIVVYCDCRDVGFFIDNPLHYADREIYQAYQKITQEYQEFIHAKQLTISYQHVKGHQKVNARLKHEHVAFNDCCDKRAGSILSQSMTAIEREYVRQYHAKNRLLAHLKSLGIANVTSFDIPFVKEVSAHKQNIQLLAEYFAQYKGQTLSKTQINGWLSILFEQNKVSLENITMLQGRDMLVLCLRLMGVFMPVSEHGRMQCQPLGKKSRVIIA